MDVKWDVFVFWGPDEEGFQHWEDVAIEWGETGCLNLYTGPGNTVVLHPAGCRKIELTKLPENTE